MDKYLNRYRIDSARAPFWDYSSNAAYFVTICTKNMFFWFGDIIATERNDILQRMNLSPIGHIANSCWHEIPNHFPFVELGAHIIMPNHVHGIVIINKPKHPVETHDAVETHDHASLRGNKDVRYEININPTPKNKFGPQSRNLASIVRGFKIGVTKNARKFDASFAWQARYHDHIIRNDVAFQRLSNYIMQNPLNWNKDRFYSKTQSNSV